MGPYVTKGHLCARRAYWAMEDVPTPYARHRQLTRRSCMPRHEYSYLAGMCMSVLCVGGVFI